MAKAVSYIGRGSHKGYVKALLNGFKLKGYDVHVNLSGMSPLMPDTKFVVFSGMCQEHDEVREQAIGRGIAPVIVDLGYMNRCNDTSDLAKGYFQVSLGHIGWVPNKDYPKDRYAALNWPLGDRDTSFGRRVMIVGQVPEDTQHRMKGHELEDWYLQRLQMLRDEGVPMKEIFIRTHPYAPNLSGRVHNSGVAIEQGSTVPLEDSLVQCRAVVTFNSTIFYEASRLGVPVICDESAHYADLAFRSFGEIKPIKMSHRLRFFYKMAYAQWTLQEMLDGLALKTLLNEIEYSHEKNNI